MRVYCCGRGERTIRAIEADITAIARTATPGTDVATNANIPFGRNPHFSPVDAVGGGVQQSRVDGAIATVEGDLPTIAPLSVRQQVKSGNVAVGIKRDRSGITRRGMRVQFSTCGGNAALIAGEADRTPMTSTIRPRTNAATNAYIVFSRKGDRASITSN